VFQDWLEKFLFTTIQKVIDVLSYKGILAINIKNSKNYNIIDPMLEFIKKQKLKELNHIKLIQSKRYKSNTIFEYIYVFQKIE